MKKTVNTAALVMLCLMLSSWGSKGHKKISQNFAACLPAQMTFLKPTWTNFVMNHAIDADSRKGQDPDESPRHYIDIDNYPVFVQTGTIPQAYDSVIQQYGYSFVIDQGILPWATIRTFDSLRNCFQRRDWNRSQLFAADLGHYVGDGHMPLHITRNYNGGMTGQTGIHSRYETSLVSRYETQIVYPADSTRYIDNVGGYVFDYLYANYGYVDSLLIADSYATTAAGGTGTDAYYQALWAKTGTFTKLLMEHASASLASLVYTAWVQAGSPMMFPNAIGEPGNINQPGLERIYPNPASQNVCIPIFVSDNDDVVILTIYDGNGNLVETLLNNTMTTGCHQINWNVNGLVPGIYFCNMKSGRYGATQKIMVTR